MCTNLAIERGLTLYPTNIDPVSRGTFLGGRPIINWTFVDVRPSTSVVRHRRLWKWGIYVTKGPFEDGQLSSTVEFGGPLIFRRTPYIIYHYITNPRFPGYQLTSLGKPWSLGYWKHHAHLDSLTAKNWGSVSTWPAPMTWCFNRRKYNLVGGFKPPWKNIII